jgi:hypothetical protein
MLNGAAVSWKSKRQPVVALSTAETELVDASSMVQEASSGETWVPADRSDSYFLGQYLVH